jgi:hypothetical protein
LSLIPNGSIGETVNEIIKITGGDPGSGKGSQWNGISVEDISNSLESGEIDGNNYLSIEHNGKKSSFHVRGIVPIIEQINSQVQAIVEVAQKPGSRQKERLPVAQSKVDQTGKLCDKISAKLLDSDTKKNSFMKFFEKCYNKMTYGNYETSASFVIRDVSGYQGKLATVSDSLSVLATSFKDQKTSLVDGGSMPITASRDVPNKGGRVAKITKSIWGKLFNS